MKILFTIFVAFTVVSANGQIALEHNKPDRNFFDNSDDRGHQVFCIRPDFIGVRNDKKIKFYRVKGQAAWQDIHDDFEIPGPVSEVLYIGNMTIGVRDEYTIRFYKKLGDAPWKYVKGMDYHSKTTIKDMFYIGNMTVGIRGHKSINFYIKYGQADWKPLTDMTCKIDNPFVLQSFYADHNTVGIWSDSTVRFYTKYGKADWKHAQELDFPVPKYADEIFYYDNFILGVRTSNLIKFYVKRGQQKWLLDRSVKDLLISDSPTKNYAPKQGYLGPSPNGIGAEYAWVKPGGKGEGVKIIIVDNPVDLHHEDFKKPFGIWGEGEIDSRGTSEGDHGTSAIGEMIAQHNHFGVNGISPDAEFGISAINRTDSIELAVAKAIDTATLHLSKGDIILLEVFFRGPRPNTTPPENEMDFGSVPVEYDQKCFDAISRATAKGIIVIEPAANGSVDLDDPMYNGRFDRSRRNSGAIMVAADSGGNRIPADFSNFGKRIDFFAWGNNIVTTGYGNIDGRVFDYHKKYTALFSGTSGASPIIAGFVACLQGIRKKQGRETFTTAQLLHIINGANQIGSSKLIGLLPDFKATLANMSEAP